MNELKHLADFISSFHLTDAPEEVVLSAKYCTLDTIGTALGGISNQLFRNIKKTYLDFDRNCASDTALWGTSQKAALRTGVFLNAMSGHILELDDVHITSKTHIGTVVIPAAWCLAEYLGKNGKDFLEAVICGYETMARIGMGFGVSSHRNKGWHVTGTAGTFGAAAACGKLLDFDGQQILDALGLAGTQSCSTWAFLSDGATNKILHPARAALSGLESCFLVLGGMRGSSRILDADDGGLFPMMSDAYDYSLVDKALGSVFEILHVDKKPYPCCRSTHCAIDAAILLKNKYSVHPQEIDHVEIETYLVGLKQCGASHGSIHPKLPTDAKFSTPYVTACALLHGQIGLGDFAPDVICQDDRQKLLAKVQVTEHPDFTSRYPKHWGCRMNIYMKNGAILTQEIRDASGSVSLPLSKKQLADKVISCCSSFDPKQLSLMITAILELSEKNKLPSLLFS